MIAELRRNLWLEFTTHRLVAAPLVIGLCFLVGGFWKADETGEWLLGVALGLSLGFWGARQAADALASEVVGRTWDGQRMSGQGAWALAWGKLIGSTAICWYAAAWAIGLAMPKLIGEPGLARIAVAGLGGGLVAQIGALAASLAILRMGPSAGRFQVTLCQLFGMALGFAVATTIADSGDASTQRMFWYGLSLSPWTFSLATEFAIVIWLGVAIHRLMRAELQYRDQPWAWFGFLLFVVVYAGGIGWSLPTAEITPTGDAASPDAWSSAVRRVAGGLIGASLLGSAALLSVAWWAGLADPKDPVRLAGWVAWCRRRDRRAVIEAPPFVQALLLAVPVGMLAVITNLYMTGLLVAGVMQVTRDMGILFACALTLRRGFVTALFYLLLVNLVVPGLADVVGASWLQAAARLSPELPWVSAVLLGLQTVALVLVIRRRWRSTE